MPNHANRRIAPLIVGLCCLLPVSARAASFEVDATFDAVDAAVGDGICAAAGGECTLRAAVQEANALPGTDTIRLPAGIFRIELVGVDDAAAAGDLDVTDDLEIVGVDSALSVIDAGGVSGFLSIASRAVVEVRGVEFRNGAVERSDYWHGAVVNFGTLAFDNCTVADSFGDTAGVIGNLHWFEVRNSTLRDNRGVLFGGGSGTTVLHGSTVGGNEDLADADGSDAFWVFDSEIVDNRGWLYLCPLIADSQIRDNDGDPLIACPGGGVVIVRSRIVDNRGTAINSDGSVIVVESSIIGNGPVSGDTARTSGLGAVGVGGITAIDGVVIRSSTIANNRGTGVDVEQTLVIENSTIVGNTSVGGFAGGVSVGEGESVVVASTIADNDGFGLSTFGQRSTILLRHSIVVGNRNQAGDHADCVGSVVLDGYNLVGGPESCFASSSSSDQIGVENAVLGPLQYNGGATPTRMPLPGSPAIDSGTGDLPECMRFDQRGARREAALPCDIGAVEVLPNCGNGELDPGEDCEPMADGDCSALCRAPVIHGDCNADGAVGVDDLVGAVAIAVAGDLSLECTAIDRDRDLRVTIDELIAAVHQALSGNA